MYVKKYILSAIPRLKCPHIVKYIQLTLCTGHDVRVCAVTQKENITTYIKQFQFNSVYSIKP